METPASLAPGTGGKLLGTERLSALPSHVRASEGSSGQAFAREVERAVERSRGDGLEQERREDLRSERRAARRAGFGRERAGEGEARAVEAVFRSEDAPAVPQPAATLRPPFEGSAAASAESSAPSGRMSGAAAQASAPVEPELAPGAGIAPDRDVTPVGASGAVARTAPELVRAVVQANEAQPVELPPARAGGKAARPASAPAPAAGPDPAVLERAAEILRQIQLHATPHVRRLTLELEPAELGRLSLQLALRAGRVAAIVRGENPETLALLEQREGELLRALAQHGIAAEAVRFELGFGGSRSQCGTRQPAAAPAAPAAPTDPTTSTAAGPSSTRLDLYA